MGMGIDKARHDETAFRVDGLRLRILFLHIRAGSDFQNLLPVYDDRTVLIVRMRCVPGNHTAILDNQHRPFLLFIFKSGVLLQQFHL